MHERVLASIARALSLHVDHPNSLAMYRTKGDNLFSQLSLQLWVLELQSRLCPELDTEFEKTALELIIAGVPAISVIREVVTRDQEWLLFSRSTDLFEQLGFGSIPQECLLRIADIQRTKVKFDENEFDSSISVLLSHLEVLHKKTENWFLMTCEIDEVYAAFTAIHRTCDPMFVHIAPEKFIDKVIHSVCDAINTDFKWGIGWQSAAVLTLTHAVFALDGYFSGKLSYDTLPYKLVTRCLRLCDLVISQQPRSAFDSDILLECVIVKLLLNPKSLSSLQCSIAQRIIRAACSRTSIMTHRYTIAALCHMLIFSHFVSFLHVFLLHK